MNIRSIKNFIVDFVYPNRCPCCDSFILCDEYICPDCLDTMAKDCTLDGVCKYCGLKNCKCGSGVYYDRVFSCYAYEGLARKGALSLKSSQNLNFAYYIGETLANKIQKEVVRYDAVVPVPMHFKNRLVRGYNQTEVISRVIAKRLGIPTDVNALRVKYSKVSQHELSKTQRLEHANGIYFEGISNVKDKYIILVDDIITTGSTLNVCSKILQDMGASSVIVAVATSTPYKKVGNGDSPFRG